jgi:hypothetical protein
LVLGLVVIAAPACGLLFSRHDEPKVSAQNAETVVEVESHHWSDVIVYLMNGNQSERLGTAIGVSTTRFSVPYRHIANGGRLRLRAHAIGGQGSFTSEDVVIQPGQSVKWTLESDLNRSSMAVY